MVLKLTKKPTASTTVQKKAGKEVVSEETAPVEMEAVQVSKQFCEVGVEQSYTHNMGDYNSCRVQVSIKIPCEHEQIDETYTFAKDWADERLSEMVAEIQADPEE